VTERVFTRGGIKHSPSRSRGKMKGKVTKKEETKGATRVQLVRKGPNEKGKGAEKD